MPGSRRRAGGENPKRTSPWTGSPDLRRAVDLEIATRTTGRGLQSAERRQASGPEKLLDLICHVLAGRH